MRILDAALRNYPRTITLFFKQPFKKTTAVVLLALLPLVIDAVQHTIVQKLIVQGVVDNLGSIQYYYLNTSTIKPQYEPLLSDDNGVASGFSPIAEISAENGLSSVANACSNQTRLCGSQLTNATASLIQCNSEVDCTQEITNCHDFDMTCTRNETLLVYPAIAYGWLKSSVTIDRHLLSDYEYVAVLDWTVRRVAPSYTFTHDNTIKTPVATVRCRIAGAWVKRVESKLRGTLRKTVVRRYDSSESASKQNTTNVDPLSNLKGKYMLHTSSSMSYLGLALTQRVSGNCVTFAKTACISCLRLQTILETKTTLRYWSKDALHG
ncbi:hypothetical protein HDU81_006957 [Chytriomyces hyalinus]|nr:hypothetical protein HDU81_006957 [Chytriomyces hyalinus]